MAKKGDAGRLNRNSCRRAASWKCSKISWVWENDESVEKTAGRAVETVARAFIRDRKC